MARTRSASLGEIDANYIHGLTLFISVRCINPDRTLYCTQQVLLVRWILLYVPYAKPRFCPDFISLTIANIKNLSQPIPYHVK